MTHRNFNYFYVVPLFRLNWPYKLLSLSSGLSFCIIVLGGGGARGCVGGKVRVYANPLVQKVRKGGCLGRRGMMMMGCEKWERFLPPGGVFKNTHEPGKWTLRFYGGLFITLIKKLYARTPLIMDARTGLPLLITFIKYTFHLILTDLQSFLSVPSMINGNLMRVFVFLFRGRARGISAARD